MQARVRVVQRLTPGVEGEGALACPSDVPPCRQLFTRAGIRGGHLEAAINLKAELETALRRSGELDIEPEEGRRGEVSAARGLGQRRQQGDLFFGL